MKVLAIAIVLLLISGCSHPRIADPTVVTFNPPPELMEPALEQVPIPLPDSQ